MRIMRSKGTSYTRFEGRQERDDKKMGEVPLQLPSRGLLLHRRSAGSSGRASGAPVLRQGDDLPSFLEEDIGLVLRQYIQWLDKVLRKPRRLRHMDLDSYRARTFLGEQLWALFASRYLDENDPDSVATHAGLQAIWRAKVHPYAKHEVSWDAPDGDKNAEDIKKYVKQRPEYRRQQRISETPWSLAVFEVPFGASHPHAYMQAAAAIEKHLLEAERKIDGSFRLRRKKPVNGFLRERGDAIAHAASDPRVLNNRRHESWKKDDEDVYSKPGDVAVLIREGLLSGKPKELPAKLVGRFLYEHFGRLKEFETWQTPPKSIWNLHNAVRLYYRRAIETRKFLEAVRAEDHRKLDYLLPLDMNELYGRLKGARSGQDLQRQIRLGKLIAHSIDLCMSQKKATAENFDALVRAGMDYFATSVGQADIKRNEAFVRVLRTSVAFAQRTLDAWVRPGYDAALAAAKAANDEEALKTLAERDVSLTDVAGATVAHLAPGRARSHGRIIFGDRQFSVRWRGEADEPRLMSRTDVLFDGSDTDKEVVWGLLRLAARVRDRCYHFNTKRRLLDVIGKGGLLMPFGKRDTVASFQERGNISNKLTQEALQRIERLLEFDLQIDDEVLALELNRLRFATHVPANRRDGILALLARIPASDDRVTPKFMTVLKKAQSLATGGASDGNDCELAPFADLVLNDLSKGKLKDVKDDADRARALNHDRIGLLRLLYDRSFPAWLEQHEKDEGFAKEVFGAVLQAKRVRRAAYDAARKKTGAPREESLAERLLSEAGTLAGLELMLQGEALHSPDASIDDERLMEHFEALEDAEVQGAGVGKTDRTLAVSDPYVPDRQLQRDASLRVHELRAELYAFLFARFLDEALPDVGEAISGRKTRSWIWSIGGSSSGGDPLKKVSAGEIRSAAAAETREGFPAWLKLFYAWLYLVPPDFVAQLRHQFRKTEILEGKAAKDRADVLWAQKPEGLDEQILRLVDPTWGVSAAPDKRLRMIDGVMGLYTRVQAAGFSGTENDVAKTLFEDPAEAAGILALLTDAAAADDEGEDSLMVLPGTRAGLRQVTRFNTLPVLQDTFRKHAVRREEIALVRSLNSGPAGQVFQTKQNLHKELVDLAKAEKNGSAGLIEKAELYQSSAIEVCEYNLALSAVRLADFANLQHLLMALLARLTDFTGLWERDRDCALLGACFAQIEDLVFEQRSDEVFLKGKPAVDGPQAEVKIYTRSSGFRYSAGVLHSVMQAGLSDETKRQVSRFFGLGSRKGEIRTEHSRDLAYRKDCERKGKTAPKPNTGHLLKVQQIRNDLAHFNVLDSAPPAGRNGKPSPRKSINMTYVINAVRALLSYDRKLKNAVPKAVAGILQRQGIAISWHFSRDRLSRAELKPGLVPHLAFLPILKIEKDRGVSERRNMLFHLPRVSPRELSMSRALFDFGSSGYLTKADSGQYQIAYPEETPRGMIAQRVPERIACMVQSVSELDKRLK